MKSSWIEKIDNRLVRESLFLMRVDRPVGTWLLLWPSLWSLMVASEGFPKINLFIIILSGTFIMRSAGCVANDLADRKIDPHVERTRLRPLAKGSLQVKHGIFLLLVLLFLALLIALQLPEKAILLCIPGAFLALTYPLTKRIIHTPQLYLGVSFGWGVIIAWAAVRDTIDWPAWILFFATVFWATGYDTIYGMVDKKDDMKIGVRSTALLFGDKAWIAIGLFYSVTLICWALVGSVQNYSLAYYLCIGVIMVHFFGQIQSVRKLPENELIKVFSSNQWVGALLFIGLIIEKIL